MLITLEKREGKKKERLEEEKDRGRIPRRKLIAGLIGCTAGREEEIQRVTNSEGSFSSIELSLSHVDRKISVAPMTSYFLLRGLYSGH